jgi:hypothetical protein
MVSHKKQRKGRKRSRKNAILLASRPLSPRNESCLPELTFCPQGNSEHSVYVTQRNTVVQYEVVITCQGKTRSETTYLGENGCKHIVLGDVKTKPINQYGTAAAEASAAVDTARKGEDRVGCMNRIHNVTQWHRQELQNAS